MAHVFESGNQKHNCSGEKKITLLIGEEISHQLGCSMQIVLSSVSISNGDSEWLIIL